MILLCQYLLCQQELKLSQTQNLYILIIDQNENSKSGLFYYSQSWTTKCWVKTQMLWNNVKFGGYIRHVTIKLIEKKKTKQNIVLKQLA
jgi:hypothetical protein